MDRSNYRNSINYYINFCLYAVILSGTAYAQSTPAPSNTNIAGPTASATGNVTNQAVQVLQGPFALNTYGSGVSCQGATFSVSPFLLRSENSSEDPETFKSANGNWGVSAGFNIPGTPAPGMSYTIQTQGAPFQFSETYLGPGVAKETWIDRTTETQSTTTSISVFTQ